MTTPCFLCKKSVTRAGLPHHYLSSEHLPLWKQCIQRSRKLFLDWIADFEAGKKTIDSKLPSFTLSKDGTKRYRVCFGCKKLDTGHREHHCDSLENMKSTVEAYKNILNEEVQEQEVKEDTVSTKELEKVKKQLKLLEELREKDEERLEKSEVYRDFAKFLIEEIQYESLTAYKEIIEKCEEQYSELKGDLW